MAKVIRSETQKLITEIAIRSLVRDDVDRTIKAYRSCVRYLATIIMTHYPEISAAESKCFAVESYFHVTSDRPSVKYPKVDQKIGKMPSYLRRAAIEAAYGAVSSFMSNYSNWLDAKPLFDEKLADNVDKNDPVAVKIVLKEIDDRLKNSIKERRRPPRLGIANVNPPLYGGNMILIEPGYRSVKVKLLGEDGQWSFSPSLKLQGRLKRSSLKKLLCPSLMLKGESILLSCPTQLKRKPWAKIRLNQSNKDKGSKDLDRVCSVDVGINTAATVAVVDLSGTVIARTFVTCGRHNDQRDALGSQITEKQSKTQGAGKGKVGKGFCAELYRRISGLSSDAARQMAKQIMDFALLHGASVMVVENLKGWKPKGKQKAQKKRFHRFQHRMLVKYLSFKCEEFGLRVLEIYARGTSRYAYDGSGVVKRNQKNMALGTFQNGRQYNADLNAAYNIAARGLEILLGMTKPKDEKKDQAAPGADGNSSSATTGQSSGVASRIPTVLADIWKFYAQTCVQTKPNGAVA